MFRSEASEDDIQSTKELQNTESLGTKVVDILTKTLYRKETASLLFIENSIWICARLCLDSFIEGDIDLKIMLTPKVYKLSILFVGLKTFFFKNLDLKCKNFSTN